MSGSINSRGPWSKIGEFFRGFWSKIGRFFWGGEDPVPLEVREKLPAPKTVGPKLSPLPVQADPRVSAAGFPLKIAIDFGTSACAVAVVPHNEFGVIDLARLELFREGAEYKSSNTISSFLALPFKDPSAPAALGRAAVSLSINAPKDRNQKVYHFHRSLKRMISDRRRTAGAKANLVVGVRKMIAELLLIALFPEESGTCEVVQNLRVTRRMNADQVKAIRDEVRGEHKKYLGLSERQYALDGLCRHGIELYVSVPNAFGAFECDIIRKGGAAALREFCEWFLNDYMPEHAKDGKMCGRTPQQIKEALSSVLGANRKSGSEKVIREADAVAWWELRQKQNLNQDNHDEWGENWLVFDVGGGSTDAALMRVGRAKFHPYVRMIKHSGIIIAGNDVDELLTYATAKVKLSKGSNSDNDHLTVKDAVETQHPPGQDRADYLRTMALAKVNWSKKMNAVLDAAHDKEQVENIATPLPAGVEDEAPETTPDPPKKTPFANWIRWLKALSGQAHPNDVPDPPQINLDGAAITTDGVDLRFEDFASQYGRFLQATVCAVCDDLFKDAGRTPKIDRVIVSGRGCQLPGVQAQLAQHLLSLGVINTSTPVVRASDSLSSGERGEGDTMAMKLACVRGCAFAASQGGINGLGFFVSQDVTLTIGAIHQSLWPAGTRVLDGMVASAVVHVPRIPSTYVDFYQRRFPKSIDPYFGFKQPWNRRQIARVGASMHKPYEFLVKFDCGTWRLALWCRPAGEQVEYDLISSETNDLLAANPDNPVTRLKLNWADEEKPDAF